MKNYTVLYAEDVPHYVTAEIEALDTVDAITKAAAYDFSETATDPDYRNAVSRRIVEVTDENDNIVAEFIALDALPRFHR